MNNEPTFEETLNQMCEYINDIENPDFENKSKIHDWKNYIPVEFIPFWNTFTKREKQMMVIIAYNGADAEEWN